MNTTTLAEVTHGRDNNFNLLRFVAALMVMITHAIALSTGNEEVTGLHVVGRFGAVLAPDIFFVVSGYLITASLLVGRDPRAFLRARMARIYPALLVAVGLTVLVVGPLVSTLPLREYFAHPATWDNLVFNTTQLFGAREGLPGVFADLPYAHAVNGSLWTLTVEVRLYLAILLLWWLAGRLPRSREVTMAWVMLSCALAAGALKLWLEPGWTRQINVVRLAPLFLIGASLYLWRRHVPLRRDWFWLALGAMVVSAPWFQVFFVVELFAIGYVVLYLAYVPRGTVRRFNELGDYSYGVYIYSFPLQQLMVMALPGVGPWQLIGLSVLVALPVAWLSWRFIEKPALALSRRPRTNTPEPVRSHL